MSTVSVSVPMSTCVYLKMIENEIRTVMERCFVTRKNCEMGHTSSKRLTSARISYLQSVHMDQCSQQWNNRDPYTVYASVLSEPVSVPQKSDPKMGKKLQR